MTQYHNGHANKAASEFTDTFALTNQLRAIHEVHALVCNTEFSDAVSEAVVTIDKLLLSPPESWVSQNAELQKKWVAQSIKLKSLSIFYAGILGEHVVKALSDAANAIDGLISKIPTETLKGDNTSEPLVYIVSNGSITERVFIKKTPCFYKFAHGTSVESISKDGNAWPLRLGGRSVVTENVADAVIAAFDQIKKMQSFIYSDKLNVYQKKKSLDQFIDILKPHEG